MAAFTSVIEHWVSDFLSSTPGEMAGQSFGPNAGVVLAGFLDAACGSEIHPADLTEPAIRDGISIGLGRLQLTGGEREGAPALLETFLAYLETSGRLSGGAALGAFARFSATAHLLKKRTRRATIKVGPNDPCPCGSGRKYKKCCMRV